MPDLLQSMAPHIENLQTVGRQFYARGWSLGTSSNYSAVISQHPFRLLVTASGKDKGQLTPHDFVRVDQSGQAMLGDLESSAETMLHVAIAADSKVGSILHTHSVWSTLLSDIYFDRGYLEISGYEMLKGLTGIRTHDTNIKIRIFDNTQDIETLAGEVRKLREAGDAQLDHAFLLRGHGMYTWGSDVDDARRHVEVLEFLFEVLGRRLSLDTSPTTR